MRLLVDIGNTRVKWARDAGAGLLESGEGFPSSATSLAADLDRYWHGIEPPSAVRVCNVTGAAVEAVLNGWTAARWQLAPTWVRSAATAHGIVNAYADPSRLGADRWVAMIGARFLFGLPVCVVSLGTAVTIDLVDAAGHHRGGLIAPGLQLMKDSLLAKTGGIWPEAVEDPSGFWGQDTGTCLDSGVSQMTAALIERAVARATVDLGEKPVLALTGGDATRVSPLLSIRHEPMPDLVLQGLARCG